MSLVPIVPPIASKAFDLANAAFEENYNPKGDISALFNAKALFWRPTSGALGALCIAESSISGARKVYHFPTIFEDVGAGVTVQETTLKTDPSTNETRFNFRCGQWEDAGEALFLSVGARISKYALATAYTGNAIRSEDEQLATNASNEITGFFIDDTGENVYFTESGATDFYVRAMSTPFDLTTMGGASVVLSISEATVLCSSVAKNGRVILVVNGDGDAVEYTGDQYDFANFTENARFATGNTGIDFATYSPLGKKMHTINSATDVRQYSTVTP